MKIRKSAVIFQTPIALFTWKELLPELEKAGLVYAKNDVYFLMLAAAGRCHGRRKAVEFLRRRRHSRLRTGGVAGN